MATSATTTACCNCGAKKRKSIVQCDWCGGGVCGKCLDEGDGTATSKKCVVFMCDKCRPIYARAKNLFTRLENFESKLSELDAAVAKKIAEATAKLSAVDVGVDDGVLAQLLLRVETLEKGPAAASVQPRPLEPVDVVNVERIVNERLDAESRWLCLVVTGLPETQDARDFINPIAIKIGVGDDILACFRPGRIVNGRNRIVKIKFANTAARQKFLSRFRRSFDHSGELEKVFCRPDLSFAEREERKKLLGELWRRRHAQLEGDATVLFIDWQAKPPVIVAKNPTHNGAADGAPGEL